MLLAAFACTFLKTLNEYCECYATLPFIMMTLTLTAQKVLEQTKGPIFSLFIVFVPVFGITRFRFTTSLTLVVLMYVSHLVCVLLCQHVETKEDILFQGYNYLGGILVGAVCHYREEVLRRRNFIMLLPFCEKPFDAKHIDQELHNPRARKQVLMDRRTLKFKNEIVEEAFYRNWYLIDSCPFDHPNAGALHRKVYRTIRFAVGGAIFSQFMLVIQDWEYLRRHFADDDSRAAYTVATTLRFLLVIPVYALFPLVMYIFGKRYYRRWLLLATSECRGGLRSPVRCNQASFSYKSTQSDSTYASTASLSTAYCSVSTPDSSERALFDAEKSPISSSSPASPFKTHYVRNMQWMSAGVVFVHSLAMGLILLLVDQTASRHNASAAPCYFIGFLNAILFPHRSGFRVRFVYATAGTVVVSIIVLIIAIGMKNPNFLSYGTYVVLANVLGMMISHEEESLRRIFFVRMTIRSDEFRRRHDAMSTLEGWLKTSVRKWRARRQFKPPQQSADAIIDLPSPKIPTIRQMSQASKYAMILEVVKAAFAFVTAVL